MALYYFNCVLHLYATQYFLFTHNMSDFIENQVQLLLAGQALENDDICNVHSLASDTISMSNYLYDN